MLPSRSTVASMRAGTSVVVAVSSIAAGPAILAPAPSDARSSTSRLDTTPVVEVDDAAARRHRVADSRRDHE